MYVPAPFEERGLATLHDFLRQQPFGLLVTTGASGLQANGLPFLLDTASGPSGTLRAHVARANPVWREAGGSEALVVFQGAHGYVSPGWYASKAESGKVVPTWDYIVVQARGRLRIVEEAAWLRGLVGELTDRHEASRPEPWRVEDAPSAYIDAMLKAIVGIEIEIVSLRGKWKLSQNRPAADREGVVRGLREEAGDDELARVVDAASPRVG